MTNLDKLKQVKASFQQIDKQIKANHEILKEVFSTLKKPNHHFTFWLMNNWDLQHLLSFSKVINDDIETIIQNYTKLKEE